MTTITQDNNVFTVIVQFKVQPDKQQLLVDAIADMIEKVTSKQPGLISTNIHISEDCTHVLNYAQWESREDYEAFIHNSQVQSFINKLVTYGEIESHTYKVALIRSGTPSSVKG